MARRGKTLGSRAAEMARMIHLADRVATAGLAQRDDEAKDLAEAVDSYLQGINRPGFDMVGAWRRMSDGHLRFNDRMEMGETLGEAADAARLLATALKTWLCYLPVKDHLDRAEAQAAAAMANRKTGRPLIEISELFSR